MSSGPPGTRREDEDGLVVMAGGARTYQKVQRSGARDQEGQLPPDRWAERDVAATLAPNDLGSDSRACELVVTHALTAEGADASEDGTGRGTPLVAMAFRENVRGEVDYYEGGGCGSVTAGGGKPGQGYQAVHAGTTVRRLTPLECERLQGFPDCWTDVDGQADSPRYRQMGNAVAVPVVEWILRRLVAVDSGSSSEAVA